MATQCLNFYHLMKLILIEVLLRKYLNTPDDSDIEYFVEADLSYPDKTKNKKTKNFPFCPENKVLSKNDFNETMKTFQPKTYVPDIE